MTPTFTHSPAAPAEAAASCGQNRLVAAGVLLVPAGLLGVAACLTADPSGMGTHRQLGLPPCGFYLMTGLPCPTCGMTTAFTHAAHGHLIQSFLTQPAGAVLSMLCACVVIVALFALIRGESLAPVFRPFTNVWVILGFGTLLAAAWVFKIVMVLHGVP